MLQYSMMLLRDDQNGFSAMVKEIKSHIQGIVGERVCHSHIDYLTWLELKFWECKHKLGRKMSQASFLEQQSNKIE